MMENIEKILKDTGAWHDGHTEFRNGFHGNGWLQKDAIVRNPNYLDQVSKLQADLILQEFPGVDSVFGPVTGGAIIASFVAKHLGKEIGVILGKQDPIIFHGMKTPKKGEKVVVVEDIVSSGTDMGRFIKFLKQSKADVLGISVWMNRKGPQIEGVKIISLVESVFKTYSKEECPLCVSGVKIKYKDIRE